MNDINDLMVILASDVCYECNSDTFTFDYIDERNLVIKTCDGCETQDSFVFVFADTEDGPQIGVYGLLNIIDGDKSVIQRIAEATE